MSPTPPALHSLPVALAYLAEAFRTRLALHFGLETAYPSLESVPSPDWSVSEGALGEVIRRFRFGGEEVLVLLTALVPHVQADFFDQLLSEVLPQGGEFSALGGVRGKQHRGVLPTGETALFLLAGSDPTRRLEARRFLEEESTLFQHGLLRLGEVADDEPALSARLLLAPEWVEKLMTGRERFPKFSPQFPAERLSTALTWNDLVLPAQTLSQVRELEAWVRHGEILLRDWGLNRRWKPGYKALFFGPPGTGKTLTASLLGAQTGKPVFRVDLSMVVSKFIGETEKNLSALFARAEHQNWILFFDEADALFGKRTSVRDAHDKYANQEVAYLLQRVETYEGLVILASNHRQNLDEAFTRRFQSIIYFPPPSAADRLALWQRILPPTLRLADDVLLPQLSQRHELTGAGIQNVIQFACLRAADRNATLPLLTLEDVQEGIRREMAKEGKLG
ncbi:MAG: ATP-binding protein [Sphingobacteriaceae bacterium]|nr:ATP-binding protein [Cytophagaceae bacterium]